MLDHRSTRRQLAKLAGMLVSGALACGCSPGDPYAGKGTVSVGDVAGNDAVAVSNAHDGSEGDCSPSGSVSLTIDTPGTYACHEPYKASFTIHNGSCSRVTVKSIQIASTVSSGSCRAPAGWNAEAVVDVVPAGKAVAIAKLTGRTFCCAAPGCTSALLCAERQDFTIETSHGVLTASADIQVNLEAGCSEVCSP
jgi:hypothetical protein